MLIVYSRSEFDLEGAEWLFQAHRIAQALRTSKRCDTEHKIIIILSLLFLLIVYSRNGSALEYEGHAKSSVTNRLP